jgi:hypothetical protein
MRYMCRECLEGENPEKKKPCLFNVEKGGASPMYCPVVGEKVEWIPIERKSASQDRQG